MKSILSEENKKRIIIKVHNIHIKNKFSKPDWSKILINETEQAIIKKIEKEYIPIKEVEEMIKELDELYLETAGIEITNIALGKAKKIIQSKIKKVEKEK